MSLDAPAALWDLHLIICVVLIWFLLLLGSSDRLRYPIVLLLGLKSIVGRANDMQALYDCFIRESAHFWCHAPHRLL